MKTEAEIRVEQQRQNYTAFDRRLIKAQIAKSDVLICLAKPVFNRKSEEWISVLTVKMVSIDKYFIEVLDMDTMQATWLSKSNIVSATVVDPPVASDD